MKHICMIVPSFTAKGGITSVVNGYKNSNLEKKFRVSYIETYIEGSKFKKFLYAFKAYLTFLILLIKDKPDLVHIHSSFGASFYRKLPFIYISYLKKICILNHIHGSEIEKLYINANKIKRLLVKDAFSKCDCLIVLSDTWKVKLMNLFPQTSIFVVENFSPYIFNKTHIGHEKTQILFLGFITELKGCFDLPSIVEELTKTTTNFIIKICGVGKEKELKEIIKNKKLTDYFEFLGWIDKKRKEELLENSDIYLLPSYSEGMPMSILEAMGYGLPIIASNVGGIPEIVINNKNGFLTNPGNIKQFADYLIILIMNSNLRYKMGRQSIHLVESKYSLNIHVKKIMKIYNYYLNQERRK